MKKSILFLSNAYPDFESSYRGVFVKQMALHLRDNGLKISVVTPKIYKNSLFCEDRDGIPVYRFPFFAGDKLLIEHGRIPYLRMIIYYITGFFLTLYSIMRNRCDLIHVHWAIPTGPIGVIVGALFRKPLIVTVHGSDLRMATTGSSLLRRIFVYVCRQATHVHSVSEVMKKEIEGLGIPGTKISTWPMGVDEVFWESGRTRKKRTDDSTITVVSNRNLLPIYDVSCLIRAIPLVLKEESRVRFIIAGDGPEKRDLEREVGGRNLLASTRFLGRVPHHQMAELLAQTDIYVSTSLSDGTSVSLLEALASGAFPIVTDIASNREWIANGENGFLVPTGDERRLADRIIEAIRNAELAEKASKKNRDIVNVKAYWERNIHRTIEIYENAMKPH
jgi:glycosyltransferase involved in cell wall biosynthesis